MPRKTVVKKPKLGPSLFLHKSTQQWTAKFDGKFVYFGKDPDEALRLYQKELPDRQAGRNPRAEVVETDNPTVGEVCNRFLTTKKGKMESGEMTPISWRDYYNVCEMLIEFFGKKTFVLKLGSADFEKLRNKLAKTRGAHALASCIQKVRTIFKYAFDADMIVRPVKFGPEFKKPSKSIMRKTRNKAPKRLFTAEELRKIIDAAKSPLKAMILLGINAGYGQSDIANLTINAIDFKKEWIDYPRPKTGVNRRCHLWPETIEALKEALKNRPEPKDNEDARLVFITKYGKRWVRVKERVDKKGKEIGGVPIDSVNLEFNKLLKPTNETAKEKTATKTLDMKNGCAFYAIRHTFRTIADEVKDQPAANFLMGHIDEHISGDYREEISDTRLKAITEFVRAWLWPAMEKTDKQGV